MKETPKDTPEAPALVSYMLKFICNVIVVIVVVAMESVKKGFNRVIDAWGCETHIETLV